MRVLDATLKVVRILSATVWLLVGLITLWGTWVTFRELGPYLRTLQAVVQGAGPKGLTPELPAGIPPDVLRRFLPAS